MAIGLHPHHAAKLPLNHFSGKAFIALSAAIAKKCGWQLVAIDETALHAQTDNGKHAHNAAIAIVIDEQTVHLESHSSGNEMFDHGRNKKNIEEFLTVYYEIYREQDIESLSLQFETLAPDTTTLQSDNFIDRERYRFVNLIQPGNHNTVTLAIIALNLTVFGIMTACGADVLDPDTETLLAWGANFRSVTLEGQWWRLISCCFIHIGIVHLVCNMLALAYVGGLLEAKLGKSRYLFAYLTAGIASSTVSIWWHGFTVSAGASGAIFGMYGIYLALLTTNFIDKYERKIMMPSIVLFITYNLLLGMQDNIDNAAHVGGMLFGILMGFVLIPGLLRPLEHRLKWSGFAVLIVVLGAFVLMVSKSVSKSADEQLSAYHQKMSDFVEMESMALEVYGHLNYDNRENLIGEIKSRSTYYWKENLSIIEEIADMDLPPQTIARNRLLKEYCELHLKLNEVLLKALNEKTTQYEAQLQQYELKIKNLLEKIRAFN